MLIITRTIDGAIEITVPELGAVATIMVVSVKGSYVRLGIDTPRHWNVERKEQADERRAAGGPRLRVVPPPED